MPSDPAFSQPPACQINPATFSVLVVDDEERNRVLLRDQLEARGYSVREADTGLQALRCVAERPPDLILLDVMMPGMDGFEVCRRLKNDAKTAPIPILLITVLSERRERLMGVRAGANDFLHKPVDFQDLNLRVSNALYSKRLYDQLNAARQQTEALLLSFLPRPIADRIMHGETTIADFHPEATVLVADLAGFTTLLAQVSPREVVFLLNEIFCEFDQLVAALGLEKIKTVGDAYLAAGGVNSLAACPAEAIAELALRMQKTVAGLNDQYGTTFGLRIGISTGPLISGVIGRQKLAYDIWGDPVNLACQIEAAAPVGGIMVDEPTYERLKLAHAFSDPAFIALKHHRALNVYCLEPANVPALAPA
jgi:class 3 adenylate cyclase